MQPHQHDITHHLGDRCSGGHITATDLARFCREEEWTTASLELVAGDIKTDPRLYWPEYVRMCAALEVEPLTRSKWVLEASRG